MTTRRTPRTAWKPGQSGNPGGRPPGTGTIGKLRASIEADIPEILAALTEQAKRGDVPAARLLLERTLPPMRPTEHAQPLALPDGTLTEQGRAVLAAIAAGELGPQQGAQLLGAIAQLGRVAEIDELERRIRALEDTRP